MLSANDVATFRDLGYVRVHEGVASTELSGPPTTNGADERDLIGMGEFVDGDDALAEASGREVVGPADAG